MRYKDFFLVESWKNYAVSTSPKNLLYDFYVLSYLSTIPISPEQKGFAGSLIGRDPAEIKLDIQEAERVLLPVLRDKLKEALFIAICAEIRHVFDVKQNWDDFKENKLFKAYANNYTIFTAGQPEFTPTRGIDTPQMTPKQKSYNDSFKAATKAINSTGSSRTAFAQLCAQMFRQLKWKDMFGGPKWGEIAEAYILLSKHPQTNQELQVAIDHAYDLQHNTNTVLDKVKEYYINNDITWLKNALDDKADLKNVYELLPKASSDMRKLALETFKVAGIKRPNLQQDIPGNDIKQKPGNNIKQKSSVIGSVTANIEEPVTGVSASNIAKHVKYTTIKPNHNFIGQIVGVTPFNQYLIKITKILSGDKRPFNRRVGDVLTLSYLTPMTFVDPLAYVGDEDNKSSSISKKFVPTDVGKYIRYTSKKLNVDLIGQITQVSNVSGVVSLKIVKILPGSNPKPFGMKIGDTAKLSDYTAMSFVDESEIEKMGVTKQSSKLSSDKDLKVGDKVNVYFLSELFYSGVIIEMDVDQNSAVVKIEEKFRNSAIKQVGDKLTTELVPTKYAFSLKKVQNIDTKQSDLIGKKIVWNSPTNHIEAIIVNRVDNMYKIKVTKIIKDEFNVHKIGGLADLHRDNINSEYFSFADESKPQSSSSDDSPSNAKSDYVNKLSEILVVGDIDKYFYQKLKVNREFTNSTKNLSDSERHELILELVKPMTNALVMSIGEAYFDKNKIEPEKQEPPVGRIVSKLKYMYVHVNNVASARKSIKKLKDLFMNNKYNSFKETMIDSGKMNIIAEKYIIEFHDDYIGAINKLFSLVTPKVSEELLHPYKHMIDYKDINEND